MINANKSESVTELLSGIVLIAVDKQLQLASQIDGHEWQFELPSGVLSLGGIYQYETQILGTESDETRTWL